MIASQISNRIGNDIACKRAQANKAGYCEQPGPATKTHQLYLLPFAIPSVKPKHVSLQGGLAKS
jgi:hypothetical protein